MSNVICHLCNGLVDRIGLQPTGVFLCRCADSRKRYRRSIARLSMQLAERDAEIERLREAISDVIACRMPKGHEFEGFMPPSIIDGLADALKPVK